MTGDEAEPPSPCVGVCRINASNTLCDGCFRSIAEIAAWRDMPSAGKRTLLEQLAARKLRARAGH